MYAGQGKNIYIRYIYIYIRYIYIYVYISGAPLHTTYRCALNDRYKSGSSSSMQNAIAKPKHVAGPTTLHKVQYIEAFSTVCYC